MGASSTSVIALVTIYSSMVTDGASLEMGQLPIFIRHRQFDMRYWWSILKMATILL